MDAQDEFGEKRLRMATPWGLVDVLPQDYHSPEWAPGKVVIGDRRFDLVEPGSEGVINACDYYASKGWPKVKSINVPAECLDALWKEAASARRWEPPPPPPVCPGCPECMPSENCRNCGAPRGRGACDYCGTEAR